jgi:hypothetical protein
MSEEAGAIISIITVWLWGISVGLHIGRWYDDYLERKERNP